MDDEKQVWSILLQKPAITCRLLQSTKNMAIKKK